MQTKYSNKWKLTCPRCKNVETAQESKRICTNCGGKLLGRWVDAFTAEDLSGYRGLACPACDMWWDHFNCCKCGAIIHRKNIDFGCLLTTAACELNGLGDDCAELIAARTFRDSYLASHYDIEKFNELYTAASCAILGSPASCLPILRKALETHIRPAAKLISAQELDKAYALFESLLVELSNASYTPQTEILELIAFLQQNKKDPNSIVPFGKHV